MGSHPSVGITSQCLRIPVPSQEIAGTTSLARGGALTMAFTGELAQLPTTENRDAAMVITDRAGLPQGQRIRRCRRARDSEGDREILVRPPQRVDVRPC